MYTKIQRNFGRHICTNTNIPPKGTFGCFIKNERSRFPNNIQENHYLNIDTFIKILQSDKIVFKYYDDNKTLQIIDEDNKKKIINNFINNTWGFKIFYRYDDVNKQDHKKEDFDEEINSINILFKEVKRKCIVENTSLDYIKIFDKYIFGFIITSVETNNDPTNINNIYVIINKISEILTSENFCNVKNNYGNFKNFKMNCDTLMSAIHNKGYIHGDIKPDNILVYKENYHISDFTIVKNPPPSNYYARTSYYILPYLNLTNLTTLTNLRTNQIAIPNVGLVYFTKLFDEYNKNIKEQNQQFITEIKSKSIEKDTHANIIYKNLHMLDNFEISTYTKSFDDKDIFINIYSNIHYILRFISLLNIDKTYPINDAYYYKKSDEFALALTIFELSIEPIINKLKTDKIKERTHYNDDYVKKGNNFSFFINKLPQEHITYIDSLLGSDLYFENQPSCLIEGEDFNNGGSRYKKKHGTLNTKHGTRKREK